MKISAAIGAVILVTTALRVHAVMPPAHYRRLAEESKIKATAVVDFVLRAEDGKRYSTQRVAFRLETAFSENVPDRFSGSCYSVLHRWQKPGVGGEIYYYPRKGDRVFVTVSTDGGWITSYTRLTPALEAALRENPGAVIFGMGEARVIEGEREKTISEAWYLYRIDRKPVGYLYAVRKEPVYEWGILRYAHRFVVRGAGRTADTRILTDCLDDTYLTPRRMVIERRGEPTVSVRFRQQRPESVSGGIFRPDPAQKENIMVVPEHTVTDLLLFEIVKRLSFETEAFSYHLLESAELHLKKSRTLAAMGKDPEHPDLHRFAETPEPGASFWVDGDRNLVRVVWDGDKEFVPTDKTTATSAFP